MNVLIAIDIFKSVPINISYQYFQEWPHQYYKKTIDISVIDMAHQYMEHPYEERKGSGLTWRWSEIQLSQSDVDIMIYMIDIYDHDICWTITIECFFAVK